MTVGIFLTLYLLVAMIFPALVMRQMDKAISNLKIENERLRKEISLLKHRRTIGALNENFRKVNP